MTGVGSVDLVTAILGNVQEIKEFLLKLKLAALLKLTVN